MYYDRAMPSVNRSLGESSKFIYTTASTAERNTVLNDDLLAAKPPLQVQGQITYAPNTPMLPDPYRIEYIGYGKRKPKRKQKGRGKGCGRRQKGKGAVVDKWGQYLYIPQPVQMQYV